MPGRCGRRELSAREPSFAILERVQRAREKQQIRFHSDTKVNCNARMGPRQIKRQSIERCGSGLRTKRRLGEHRRRLCPIRCVVVVSAIPRTGPHSLEAMIYVIHVYQPLPEVALAKPHCQLTDESQELIRVAMTELNLSARAYDRILKVSRTVADLAASDAITPEHVSEAIQYRTFDRTLWV
jgi:predicted ATPase with chaperone activity